MKTVILLLSFLLVTPHAWGQSLNPTERKSLEKEYVEGRDIFYAALQKKAVHAQLEEAYRKKLLDAPKKISGLYEHLINFYYFAEQKSPAENDSFDHIKILAGRLAKEFMSSLPSNTIRALL